MGDFKTIHADESSFYMLGRMNLLLSIAFILRLGIFPLVSSVSIKNPNGPVWEAKNGAGVFEKYAVASDGGPCSMIGANMLEKGGSVVDAAIATFLCIGLYNSQSAGIGGGFFMTIYDPVTGESDFLNAREVAPSSATEDMYKDSPGAAFRGGLSIAVPTEVAGYWEAHQKYGKLPWAELFQPAIDMAENGFPMGPHSAKYMNKGVHDRKYNFWQIFENEDGSLKKEGDIIRWPKLAETYRRIAAGGADEFYRGSLSSDIIDDIKNAGGIVAKEDLDLYRPQWKEPMKIKLDDVTLHAPPPPSGGPVTAMILKILDGYNFNRSSLDDENKVTTYHRIVESFRFAFAKKASLGDDTENPEITQLAVNMTSDWMASDIRHRLDDDKTHEVNWYDPSFQLTQEAGTSHLSIIGPDGTALAMTSTINYGWGSKVMGEKTGIIFNDEMQDFSLPGIKNKYGLPPSPSNYPRPGKCPQSSMSPSIVVDESGNVKAVVGGSGGTRIISRTALTLINMLWFGMDAEESINSKTLYDKLVPDLLKIEEGFDQEIIDGLRDIGHHILIKKAHSAVQAIYVHDNGDINAASDPRKGGYPAGF